MSGSFCSCCFMSRPHRIECPCAGYHVTSRGKEKKPVFKADHDRESFLNAPQETPRGHPPDAPVLREDVLRRPCNEKACCRLMTRYHSDVRRGEAIRTYGRRERALC